MVVIGSTQDIYYKCWYADYKFRTSCITFNAFSRIASTSAICCLCSSADLLYLLSQLKSRFENSRFQTSDFNPIKSENMDSTEKTPQSFVLSYQRRVLFSISGAALHLLLIVVALHVPRYLLPHFVAISTSQGLWPQTHPHL